MLWKLIVTTTLVLAIAGIAQAGQLVTPPLERVSTGDDFECFVVNTSGSKEITVTVEIINELGSVQLAAADVTILPGRLLRVEDYKLVRHQGVLQDNGTDAERRRDLLP